MDSLETFLSALKPWLDSVGVPQNLHEPLYTKFKNDIFDAGASFSIAELEEEEEEDDGDKGDDRGDDGTSERSSRKRRRQRVLVANGPLPAESDIWIVDHAWTFKYRRARQQLESNTALRNRIASMLCLDLDGESTAAEEAKLVMEHAWKLVGSYRPSTGDKPLQDLADDEHDSIWYILDDVGSAICHLPQPLAKPSDALEVVEEGSSRSVNVKLVAMPVCFPEKGYVVSFFWPTAVMEEGDVCCAAGRFSNASASTAESMLVASHVLYGDGEDGRSVPEAIRGICDQAFALRTTATSAAEQQSALLLASSSQASCASGTYPKITESTPSVPVPIPFFTDSQLVVDYVTDTDHFRLVGVQEEAKIMWMAHYAMHRSDEFPFAMFVSQLPEERFFTNKRELALLLQRRLGFRPWMQVTYDAATELAAFVADYEVRGAVIAGNCPPSWSDKAQSLRSVDGTNLWIAKPNNLARSIDMTVSDSLPWLLRVAETGPKIISKYISNPATLRGRKFDLRFVLAVRSLQTSQTCLEAYLYNVFWTRFAAEPYSRDSFDVYEKHWTVMNYASPDKLLQLHYNDFIPEFDEQYRERLNATIDLSESGGEEGRRKSVWTSIVMPKVVTMMREMLLAVEPDDIPHDRFRAAYGVDVMVREEFDASGRLIDLQPVLLEVTFSPDCKRACKYHPHFFNDVFATLFLGEPKNMTRIG